MSKMTSCFIKLLGELPDIFSQNGSKEKSAIKTVINGQKLAGHAAQALNKYRKSWLTWVKNIKIYPNTLKILIPIYLEMILETH